MYLKSMIKYRLWNYMMVVFLVANFVRESYNAHVDMLWFRNGIA